MPFEAAATRIRNIAKEHPSDRNNGKFFLQAGFLITTSRRVERNPQPTMDILTMNFDLDKDY
jgi:hypothetical protein